jgi:hypothetical protein
MSTKDRSDQGIQPIEDRTDLGVGELGMVVEGVAGVLAAAGSRKRRAPQKATATAATARWACA